MTRLMSLYVMEIKKRGGGHNSIVDPNFKEKTTLGCRKLRNLSVRLSICEERLAAILLLFASLRQLNYGK